ncbi:AraC family transcriptional regulator [Amorphus orientalis]|uniref:AraC-like DNA-binding protein n=1 Tax=Amorphus orientalis TaxID=649198 RepID=A0AAE3VR46_9HYPH|nr:AraC family transcriptional regulator [Amorphus orientalis]MDQ0316627.1 AraC-like DNA-binding protein [Amorphus orientalis]
MSDPLAQIVSLLKPNASFAKQVIAGGSWIVRRSDVMQPFYCAMLEGACMLEIPGETPVRVERGDFVLVPMAQDFISTSLTPPPKGTRSPRVEIGPGVYRLGDPDIEPDVRMLAGHCHFGSEDATLLVSLLPRVVHVSGEDRLTTLLELVNGETRAARPGRDVVLERLLEVMLIEALRVSSRSDASPGLLRGLADARLAVALRQMHAEPTRAWTVAELARTAGLSRSTFFERFRREVGAAPMDYLAGWRMALAKDLLRKGGAGVAQVASQVGYASASTFSVAFARHVGMPPVAYAREGRTG